MEKLLNGGYSASIEKLIDINEVKYQTSLGRSTIYDLIAKGGFPKQIKIGSRAARWLQSEVQGWVHTCASQRQVGV